MNTLTNAFSKFIFIVLAFFFLQSCTKKAPSNGEIRVTGRILDEQTNRPVPNSTFELIDDTSGPQSMADFFSFVDSETVTVDEEGFFDVTLDLENTADRISWKVKGDNIIFKSDNLEIDLGETLDIGDLQVTRFIPIKFDLSNIEIYDRTQLKIKTELTERNIQKFTENSVVDDITEGIIFPNQENLVTISIQRSIDTYTTYEILVDADNLNPGDTIVLEQ